MKRLEVTIWFDDSRLNSSLLIEEILEDLLVENSKRYHLSVGILRSFTNCNSMFEPLLPVVNSFSSSVA